MEKIEIKEKNPFKRLLIAFLLFITSLVLKYVVGAISVVFVPLYYLITFKWKKGAFKLADWLYNIALSNDQHGNVVNAETLQIIFTKKGGEKFGNPDDTVSYVLAKNKYQLRLNKLGKAMGWLLDKIDHSGGGHLYKAIGMKIESDKEAKERLERNNYYCLSTK